MGKAVLLGLGALLIAASAGLGYVAYDLAVMPSIDADDASSLTRLTMVFTAGACMALLGGVTLTIMGARSR